MRMGMAVSHGGVTDDGKVVDEQAVRNGIPEPALFENLAPGMLIACAFNGSWSWVLEVPV